MVRLLVHLLEVTVDCSESDAAVSLCVLLGDLLVLLLHVFALAFEGQHLLPESIDGLLLGLLLSLGLLAVASGLLHLDAEAGYTVLYGGLTRLAALEERQGCEASDLLSDLVSFEFDVLQGVFEVVGSLGT